MKLGGTETIITEMLPSHLLSKILHDVERLFNAVACTSERHDELERLDEFGVECVLLVALPDGHFAHHLQLRHIMF